jgi:hypothetical protein
VIDMKHTVLGAAVRSVAALAACACLGWGASAQANAVTDWNAATVQYVAGGGGVPAGRGGPVGFLDVALVQAAVHDAVQAIEGRYDPYFYAPGAQAAGALDAAVAAAAHGVLVQLYPSQQASLDTFYDNYLAAHGLVGDPGLAVGQASAAALFTQYRPLMPTIPFFGGTGPGEWRPTSTVVPIPPMAFLTLAVTDPYTLNSVSQFRPEPPPPLTSMRYVREYNEVKAAGSAAAYPNPNTAVADFWNTDPLQRWNGALRGIAVSMDVGESARLFALANLATADTLMAVFEAKRFYNLWRPITAIRNDDGNPKTAPDTGWAPYIPNPPYPEYPSGMNGVAGAMTETLRLFFGTDEFAFSIPGATTTRPYTSFSQAAHELIEVRILQGIHFRSAEEDGSQLGAKVAHWTFQKFLGTDHGADQGVSVDWVVEH